MVFLGEKIHSRVGGWDTKEPGREGDSDFGLQEGVASPFPPCPCMPAASIGGAHLLKNRLPLSGLLTCFGMFFCCASKFALNTLRCCNVVVCAIVVAAAATAASVAVAVVVTAVVVVVAAVAVASAAVASAAAVVVAAAAVVVVGLIAAAVAGCCCS